MGYTQHEKDTYEDCGYHNYKEFIEDIDNLLSKRYGPNHGITYTKKLKMYRQPRLLDNHDITFDFSNGNEKTQILKELCPRDGLLVCDGRAMFNSWRITGDIEECIFFHAEKL